MLNCRHNKAKCEVTEVRSDHYTNMYKQHWCSLYSLALSDIHKLHGPSDATSLH